MGKIRYIMVRVLMAGLMLGFCAVSINADENRCACPPEAILKPDSNPAPLSSDMVDLQRFLQRMGYYHGPCSGLFNLETSLAIKRFQHAHGLQETGIVDGPTWEALGDTVHGAPVAVKPPSENIRIVVDLDYMALMVLVDGQPFQSFPIAIGRPETPSPVGSWTVIKKGKWSGGFGTRWIGLNVPWGIFGIHGTNKPWSIGRLESHGCIRMFNQDVEAVFRWVRVGTPVYVIGDPFEGRRTLSRDERGPDVYYLQKRLRQLGFYQQVADGYFNYETEQAVIRFQKKVGLEPSGLVEKAEYTKLRLLEVE